MRRYYRCRDCAVGVGLLTQDQALTEIANGHTLFSDPAPMPVADALADAETLRNYQRDPFPPNLLLRVLAPDAYDVPVDALRCGVYLPLWERGHFYETERLLVEDAQHAARVAFRAAPGLRGSK